MQQLARITVTRVGGTSVSLRAADIELIDTSSSGSIITLDSGKQIEATESVATLASAVDTLWGEYTTALGDPT